MYRPKYRVGEGHNVMEHAHRGLHNRMRRDVTTVNGEVVSVVYITDEPTFSGVIGAPTSSQDEQPSFTEETAARSSATRSAYVSIYAPDSSTTTDSQAAPTSQSNVYSQILASGPTASSHDSLASATATESTSFSTGTSNANSASSSDSTSASANEGMSTAGKAGLAIGIILAIGAVLGLILFLLAKKKKQIKAEQARQDAEKNAAAASAAARAAAFEKQEPSAPQLTLRPASSFLPEILSGGKNRLSQGNMLGGSNQESHQMREQYLARSEQQNIPMTEKPLPAENPFRDPENPFADPARSPPPVSTAPTHIAMPEPTPAAAPIPMPMPGPDHTSEKIAVDPYERHAPHNDNFYSQSSTAPEPIEMPSPPIGAQTSQPSRPPPQPVMPVAPSAPSAQPVDEGNVYRVLLDFIPSMDDELELRAGQVVRLLHEYDDGWCLAAKLDRSRQGAVPRTCLAAKPSKPRPGPGPRPNGPPGANGRPMSPSMRNGPPPQGRPMSPAGRNRGPPPSGMRPMSPGAYNQSPRPLSPGPRSTVQKRSMSPGPYGHSGGPAPMAHSSRRRSNSSSQTAREVRERRQSPPGPSPLNAAAVPGMAI